MRLTVLGRATALAAGVMAVAACDVVLAQKESETVNRTVAFPANGTLKLRNFSGDVHITATSGHDVVVKAVRDAERDRLDHVKLDIESSGSTVSIDANKRDDSWRERDNNVVHTTFDIEVPASAMLDVDVFSSHVTIEGVTGSQRLHTFSGEITVNGAKSPITAETFNGDVDIEAKAAGASPDLTVHTFSGHISAKLADNAAGSVTFDSFSGRFDSDLPLALHSAGRARDTRDRHRGDQSSDTKSTTSPAPSGDSKLQFHTFSGSVKIVK